MLGAHQGLLAEKSAHTSGALIRPMALSFLNGFLYPSHRGNDFKVMVTTVESRDDIRIAPSAGRKLR